LGAVAGAINAWQADGGGDTPEAQLFALDQVAQCPGTGWRPGAKRIIVWFGDAPGHEPVCPGAWPDEAAGPGAAGSCDTMVVHRHSIDITTLVALLQNQNIVVVAISLTTGAPGGLNGNP